MDHLMRMMQYKHNNKCKEPRMMMLALFSRWTRAVQLAPSLVFTRSPRAQDNPWGCIKLTPFIPPVCNDMQGLLYYVYTVFYILSHFTSDMLIIKVDTLPVFSLPRILQSNINPTPRVSDLKQDTFSFLWHLSCHTWSKLQLLGARFTTLIFWKKKSPFS